MWWLLKSHHAHAVWATLNSGPHLLACMHVHCQGSGSPDPTLTVSTFVAREGDFYLWSCNLVSFLDGVSVPTGSLTMRSLTNPVPLSICDSLNDALSPPVFLSVEISHIHTKRTLGTGSVGEGNGVAREVGPHGGREAARTSREVFPSVLTTEWSLGTLPASSAILHPLRSHICTHLPALPIRR